METSGQKVRELQKTMTNNEIKKLAKKKMDESWGEDSKEHNYWMRIYNNTE